MIDDQVGRTAAHTDVQHFRDEFPTDISGWLDVRGLELEFGLERGAITDSVSLLWGVRPLFRVLRGDIDAAGVRNHLDAEPTGHSDFDVYRRRVAVRDGLIVGGRAYDRALDTAAGDDESVATADTDWSRALEDVRDATIAVLSPASQHPWHIAAVGMRPGTADTVEVAMFAYFDTPGAATDHRDDVRDTFRQNPGGAREYEVTTLETRGERVVIEATAFDFRWP